MTTSARSPLPRLFLVCWLKFYLIILEQSYRQLKDTCKKPQPSIQFLHLAGVVELVDTQVSDACGGNPVEVQILSSANGSLNTIVSFLSGPVEMISIGIPANFSTSSKYFWAFVGKSLNCLIPAVEVFQPGISS